MKEKMRRPFLLSETDTEYFNDKVDKIELVHGKLENKECIEYLSIVNRCFHESDKFHRDKDFLNSIETLKNAYIKTLELKEPSCIKFAELLRSTILNSLENIRWELEKMSSGIFRSKRYESSRQQVDKFLRAYRKNGQTNVLLQENKQEDYSFEEFLKVQTR